VLELQSHLESKWWSFSSDLSLTHRLYYKYQFYPQISITFYLSFKSLPTSNQLSPKTSSLGRHCNHGNRKMVFSVWTYGIFAVNCFRRPGQAALIQVVHRQWLRCVVFKYYFYRSVRLEYKHLTGKDLSRRIIITLLVPCNSNQCCSCPLQMIRICFLSSFQIILQISSRIKQLRWFL
jgi:hypothetical protein